MLALSRTARITISTAAALALSGCGVATSVQRTLLGGPTLGAPATGSGFLGGVAADEPRAALVGKQILEQGGSAADAATAMGFALAVTLGSRAGLGAGGACLVYHPGRTATHADQPEAVVFTTLAATRGGGDRPAGVPMLARGLLALQARDGVLPIGALIAPAEQLARLGVPVPSPLAQDLAVVDAALLADAPAARIFGRGGAALVEGDLLIQTDLSNTLAGLRLQGARYLYEGDGAKILVAQTPSAGGPMTAADLQNAAPRWAAPLILPAGKSRVAFLPPPADGGLAAAAAFQRLQSSPADLDGAQARAMGAASAWRGGSAAPDAILASDDAAANHVGALPASTSLVALDRTGGAVACAFSMGNLFGTGRVVEGTGMVLAASPAAVPPPLLAAALAWNPQAHAFRAAVAGSGQEGAALGVAAGMMNTLAGKSAMPATVPSPGRINAVACTKYLPGDTDACSWATDPRNAGLATGDGSS